MKKINSDIFDGIECYVFALGVLAMVVIPLVFNVFNAKPIHSKEYPQTMVVTYINEYTDYVQVETATGYTYGFWGIEDYEVGDIVSVTMNDNATENDITDDKIVEVRFSGFTESEVK